MLGYTGGKFTTNSHFGDVPDEFSLDDVKCSGREKSIMDCPHVTNDNCGAKEGAGVVCFNEGESKL